MNENERSAVEFDCVRISLARNNVPKTCRRQHRTWRRHNFTRLERKVLVFFGLVFFFYHLISAHSSKFNSTVCRHTIWRGATLHTNSWIMCFAISFFFGVFVFFSLCPRFSTRCLSFGFFHSLLLRFAFLIDIRYCWMKQFCLHLLPILFATTFQLVQLFYLPTI